MPMLFRVRDAQALWLSAHGIRSKRLNRLVVRLRLLLFRLHIAPDFRFSHLLEIQNAKPT